MAINIFRIYNCFICDYYHFLIEYGMKNECNGGE